MTREEQEQMILENVPQVYEAGRGSIKNEVANALKGSASGEVVALKDVSPLEHGLGVRVSSKNLLGEPYMFNKVSYENGVYTQTAADSGNSIRFALMLCKNDANTQICFGKTIEKKLGKHTLTFTIESDDLMDSVWFGLSGQSLNNYAYYHLYLPKGIYTISWEMLNVTQGEIAWTNIQIEKGTTATAYTPFVPDVGAVKLRAQGANIINIAEMLNDQLVDNGDGTYTFTKNGASGLRFSNYCEVNIPIGTYIKITNEIIDYNTNSERADSFGIQFIGADNTEKDTVSFFPENRGSSQYFTINVSKITIFADSTTPDGSYVRFKNLQIEYGTVGSEYEPYIEPVEYAVNADGTVEGVKSISPATTLTTDTVGALIEVDYNRDINKAFEELRKVILSLGGIL